MTSSAWKRGAYISEGGDKVFLPVSDYTYNEARSVAASFAEEMGDSWERTRYTNKGLYALHDHEDFEECDECPPELAWRFELYEGTYRG